MGPLRTPLYHGMWRRSLWGWYLTDQTGPGERMNCKNVCFPSRGLLCPSGGYETGPCSSFGRCDNRTSIVYCKRNVYEQKVEVDLDSI